MPIFTAPLHESNDCHDPATGEFCAQHGVKPGDYLRVHTADGKKLRLKLKKETGGFIHGVEVDHEGDEIARPGKFDERLHLIQKSMITKVQPLELDRTFATLRRRRERPTKEFNPYHAPAGTPAGGQFASSDRGSGSRPVYKSTGEQAAAEGRVYAASPDAFKAALQANKRADTLSDYSTEELRGMKLFMLEGGKAGYAIKGGSELVNLFNNGGEDTKGAGPWLVLHAIEHGARHGDHFDGFLTGFYQNLGFSQVRREANWTPGGPDVIYMRWSGGDPKTARARYRQHRRVDAG